MQCVKDLYLKDISAFRQILCNSAVLDGDTKRDIWTSIGAKIELSAVFDNHISDNEMEEINRVLDGPLF